MNIALFACSAIITGCVFTIPFAVVGRALPASGHSTIAGATLIVGGLYGLGWYLSRSPRWLPSSPLQVARDTARRPIVGPIVFGGVLGVGWMTRVATPLVWVGLAASLARGSFSWAALYGAAFGAGRAAQLPIQYFTSARDASERLEKTIFSQARLLTPVAVAALFFAVFDGLSVLKLTWPLGRLGI